MACGEHDRDNTGALLEQADKMVKKKHKLKLRRYQFSISELIAKDKGVNRLSPQKKCFLR